MAGTPLTPQRASVLGKIGGHTTIARHGSDAIAARARAGLVARFEREVDPHGALSDEERATRVRHAKSAYFTKLILKRHDRNRRQRDAAAEAAGA